MIIVPGNLIQQHSKGFPGLQMIGLAELLKGTLVFGAHAQIHLHLFFLFIENPIEIGELPDTGDYGIDLTVLLGCAVAAGVGYLACGTYAKKHKE